MNIPHFTAEELDRLRALATEWVVPGSAVRLYAPPETW